MPVTYLGGRAQNSATSATTITATGFSLSLAPHTGGFQFAVCAIRSNAVISTATAGWTKISQTNSGATLTVALFVASTTAANPVFTWTGAVGCYCIGAAWDSPDLGLITNAIAVLSTNTGNTSPHTANSITAAVNGGLCFAFAISENETAVYGATPAGWTERWDSGSNATTDIRSVMATRNATTVGATGNVAWTQSAVGWVAFQIEIGASNPPGPQLDAASLEFAAAYGSTDNSVREYEIAALLNTGAGLTATEYEIALLLNPPRAPSRIRATQWT